MTGKYWLQFWDEVSANLLSLFMGEVDAEKYSNIDLVVELIKSGKPDWQALVSMGLISRIFYTTIKAKRGAEEELSRRYAEELRRRYIDTVIDPLQTQYEFLKSLSIEILDGEQAHRLFHTRFALGLTLLSIGETDRAEVILRELVATPVSTRGRTEFSSGPGITLLTNDIRRGKFSITIFTQEMFEEQSDYRSMIFMRTETVACEPSEPELLESVPIMLDKWATVIEANETVEQIDFPNFEWLDLFAEIGVIISICLADVPSEQNSSILPNECSIGSAQYFAWKFGQMIGRYALHSSPWASDPFEATSQVSTLSNKELAEDSLRTGQEIRPAIGAVLTILSEHSLKSNWETLRNRYIKMWSVADVYHGLPLSEIPLESDLYWAMRIGFADMMIAKEVPPSVELPEPKSIDIIASEFKAEESIRNLIWPLATSYKIAKSSTQNPVKKLQKYCRTCELVAVFNSIVLMSALPNEVLNNYTERIWTKDKDAHKKMTFGKWCGLYRRIVNIYAEEPNLITSLPFSKEFYSGLTDRQLVQFLDKMAEIRNKYHGHSPDYADEIIERKIFEITPEFGKFFSKLSEIYSSFELIYPKFIKSTKGKFIATVTKLHGSEYSYSECEIELNNLLETDVLHLFDPRSESSIKLLPELAKLAVCHTCKQPPSLYLYNDLDKDKGEAIYTSYFYETHLHRAPIEGLLRNFK